MKYTTYYEERNTITVGRYQQLKQRMLDEGQSYQTETAMKSRFTWRKNTYRTGCTLKAS